MELAIVAEAGMPPDRDMPQVCTLNERAIPTENTVESQSEVLFVGDIKQIESMTHVAHDWSMVRVASYDTLTWDELGKRQFLEGLGLSTGGRGKPKAYSQVFCVSDGSEAALAFLESGRRAGIEMFVFGLEPKQFPKGSFVIESSRQVICYLPGRFHHRENLLMKRLVDVIVALPTVLFLLPIAAIVVKLFQLAQSPGPLFFRQERSGASGESFEILKFRSMHVRKPHEPLNPDDKSGRVYRFGAWLRKHSMDELPQFWNVIKGDLSVVGPRPHLAEHDTQFVAKYPAYVRRFRVKPGITGLAQVRGHRGAVLTEEDIRLRAIADLAYIDRWSVTLDLIIIAKTALQVLRPPKSAR